MSWRGGMDATVYFSDTTDGILFALSIFKFATMIIADVFMVRTPLSLKSYSLWHRFDFPTLHTSSSCSGSSSRPDAIW